MDSQDSSLDRISNLPSIIIENILCLVPIKEAVRTSILSKDWRYTWTKIPKLVFTEKDMLMLGEIFSKDALLHFLSSCPLLKHFELEPGFDGCDDVVPIIELFKCLPVIEHLTIFPCNIECDRVSGKLPSAFIHLKYFCLKDMYLFDGFGLRHLCFVIRNSPNLEKIKLEIDDGSLVDDDGKKFVTLKDCSDIWLEHLKELEIVGFACQKAEMEFVKLIFAQSPVLRKVKMILDKKVTTDEELIKRILSGSPLSPLAEMIVERQRIAKKICWCC
ncbi:F-box/FBD/LRR-repeat protein-like protein [Tanacetum coccineum]